MNKEKISVCLATYNGGGVFNKTNRINISTDS